MSDPIRIPTVESVQRLYNDLRSMADLYHGTPIRPREPRPRPSFGIRQAISKEDGEACSVRAVGGRCKPFEIEFLTRKWISDTEYEWEATGETALCFNDFMDDVPEDTLLDVAHDSSTEHWKIVVWTCEDV